MTFIAARRVKPPTALKTWCSMRAALIAAAEAQALTGSFKNRNFLGRMIL